MNTGTGMGFTRRLAIAAALLLPGAVFAAAPPDLAGMWEGKLAVDARTSLTVQFTFSKGADGAWTGVLNSPDNPDLKNAAVSSVTWDGNNLKLQVASLSGSYAGTLKNGRIGGQWTQPGGALPLELAPYRKPVVTAAAAQSLAGSWTGALATPAGTRNLVFQFKQGSGGFEGTFGIPDQSANLPMTNVTFENGDLSMKIPQAQLEFKGKLAGDQIIGKLTSPAGNMPPDGLALTMKRGAYKPPVVALKLSAEAFAALKGKWQGTIEITNRQTGQKAQIPLIVRFQANDRNEYQGFLDSPSQGAKDIAVTEVSLTGDKMTAKVASIGGEFSGTLSGNTITGDWAQPSANLKTPLTLTR